jgi:sugar O-acyltransferase (sialic acid O-acetyltransferase NeuD family)
MILDAIRSRADLIPDCFLDNNRDLLGTEVDGVPVRGDDDSMPEIHAEGTTHFIVGLGALDDRGLRRQLFELGKSSELRPISIVHPAAICSPGISIGEGTFIGPAAIVNIGSTIGDNVILNSGSIVEHDCTVSHHSHVASGACLGGGSFVGKDCLIGAGSLIKNGISIGDQVVVGAGSVVVRDVHEGLIVIGVPAVELTDE